MIDLCHIIAVRKAPAEIRESTVPASQAAAKLAQLRKGFDTVFIHRRFRGERREVTRA